MVLGVFIARPPFGFGAQVCRLRINHFGFGGSREREDAEFNGRGGHLLPHAEKGLIHRRLAHPEVFLPRNSEVDTQKHR